MYEEMKYSNNKDEILRKKALEFTEKAIKDSFGDDREVIELFRLIEVFRKMKNMLNSKIAECETLEKELVEKLKKEVANIELLKEKLGERLSEKIRILMPNTSEILGEELAAKFLEHVGSLEKLARMTSSTIQVLGAERALFRHMKGKGTPPKHGLLFSHPYVSSAKEEERGKISRIMASKVSLALKMDFYKSGYKAEELKKEIEEKIGFLKNERAV
jgi:nucleolar protein 56